MYFHQYFLAAPLTKMVKGSQSYLVHNQNGAELNLTMGLMKGQYSL